MRFARAVLRICLVASLGFGVLYLLAPGPVTRFAGIEHATPAGLTDLRATYAGFQLGMAGLLAWCLRDTSRHAAGLVGFACAVGALGLSRGLGLLLDGFSPEMALATGIELALTGLAIYALARIAAETRGNAASR